MGIESRTSRSVLECGGRALKGRRHRSERTQDLRSSLTSTAFVLLSWRLLFPTFHFRTKAVSRFSACHRTPGRCRDFE